MEEISVFLPLRVPGRNHSVSSIKILQKDIFLKEE
jgi:hypothetical protein